jgi:hypothetical protein
LKYLIFAEPEDKQHFCHKCTLLYFHKYCFNQLPSRLSFLYLYTVLFMASRSYCISYEKPVVLVKTCALSNQFLHMIYNAIGMRLFRERTHYAINSCKHVYVSAMDYHRACIDYYTNFLRMVDLQVLHIVFHLNFVPLPYAEISSANDAKMSN